MATFRAVCSQIALSFPAPMVRRSPRGSGLGLSGLGPAAPTTGASAGSPGRDGRTHRNRVRRHRTAGGYVPISESREPSWTILRRAQAERTEGSMSARGELVEPPVETVCQKLLTGSGSCYPCLPLFPSPALRPRVPPGMFQGSARGSKYSCRPKFRPHHLNSHPVPAMHVHFVVRLSFAPSIGHYEDIRGVAS